MSVGSGPRVPWGDLASANTRSDDPQAIRKLYEKVKSTGTETDPQSQARAVAEAFQAMELDPEVTKRTLGEAFGNVGPASILATTRKLLQVSRGEAEPDDRDAMAYQRLLGPEDLFAERIKKTKNIIRNMLWKSASRRSIDHIAPGALTAPLQQAFTLSGLGQALEEVNPAEILDHQARVTRRGEGGIQDTSAIPLDSRAVAPSQLGLIDYLRTPESLSTGVELRMARNTQKGSDGRLYTRVLDARTGESQLKSAQDLADITLGFAGSRQSGRPYVEALQNNRIRIVPRDQVDYELPDTESSFSHIGNLIPFKSMVKGQRSIMGSRFITQALPLQNAEAPLVQSGVPETPGTSFEQLYGTHMGALRAPRAGVVTAVGPDGVEVRYTDEVGIHHSSAQGPDAGTGNRHTPFSSSEQGPDAGHNLAVSQHSSAQGPDAGTGAGSVARQKQNNKEVFDLYTNHPLNRKTAYHQTPTVKVGQTFKAGDLLARSNYTDDEGTTALGMNARVAYMPDEGFNYEDAISISESFARRMKSEHMYQHEHEWEPGDHKGKKAFISMFPSEYTREQLKNFDDDGVVKPGTVLRYDDPMILIASERERNRKSLVRSRTTFRNNTQTWKHHSPGVVTDVVATPRGPAVTVKTYAQMNVADKLAGRVGDKGVIARIIPDEEMPVAADGKPVERCDSCLHSPNSVIDNQNCGNCSTVGAELKCMSISFISDIFSTSEMLMSRQTGEATNGNDER
jgi:DNA-directed RNA polymerase subunit beta